MLCVPHYENEIIGRSR